MRLLLDAGAKINEQGKYGETALINAAYRGSAAAVGLLLERGADRSLKDKKGKTALDHANEKKRADVVALLAAASPSVPNQHRLPAPPLPALVLSPLLSSRTRLWTVLL